MKKVIATINMTLDGICDHTAADAGPELHQHYTDLLSSADTILYGRITYQLMEYWRDLVKNPTGKKSMDEFALVIDNLQKIVFSRTLTNVDWETAKLATRDIKTEITELKKQPGKNILIGSRSLIISSMKAGLIDEFQLCIHPVIAGAGLLLFEDINSRITLKLVKTKTLNSGAIILYYEPVKKADS